MEDIKKKLWKTEQEILDVFHDVCTKNNLRYSLAYGTLIGAVRHKGFIPWDDDIDVLMPREDYDKLIEIWGKQIIAGCILQNPENHFDLVNNFVKIRKDNTTFIMFEDEKSCSFHTGIFIDIFPLDRLAPIGLLRKKQKLECMLSLLFNRGYVRGTGVITFFEKTIITVIPRASHKKIELWFSVRARKWNYNSKLEYFGFQTVPDMRHHYRYNQFDNLIELEFEGKKYKAFKDYDQVLKDEFGDYMQLPPEDERVWKHHPLVIDFEHNYEELKNEDFSLDGSV